MVKVDGRKTFRLGTHMMFLMIKTGIFKAYGRFIFSCYKLPDKGKDRIYKGRKRERDNRELEPKPDNKNH